MTVSQLIAKLQEMPQHLPVAVSDWNEAYADPNEIAAEWVELKDENSKYVGSLGCLMTGAFVQIGD